MQGSLIVYLQLKYLYRILPQVSLAHCTGADCPSWANDRVLHARRSASAFAIHAQCNAHSKTSAMMLSVSAHHAQQIACRHTTFASCKQTSFPLIDFEPSSYLDLNSRICSALAVGTTWAANSSQSTEDQVAGSS